MDKKVDESIIEAIKYKYKNEYMIQKTLNEAEKKIMNYFQELKECIQDIEKAINEKISLEFNKDGNMVEFRIEDEYIIFKRHEKSIKVLMSNFKNDIPECEKDEFTAIIPYDNFKGCKYNEYKFQSEDINMMISKAFKSLNLNL